MVCSLLGYRSTTDYACFGSTYKRNTTAFCVFILYYATLLNSLISSNCFVDGFSLYKIMVSTNAIDLILLLSFQLGYLYFFFLHLIALCRTSSTLSYTGGKTAHAFLFLVWQDIWFFINYFFFFFYSRKSFYHVKKFSFMHGLLSVFIMKESGILSDAFCASRWTWFSSFIPLMWCITLVHFFFFFMLNHLYSWDKTIWSWYNTWYNNNNLVCCWI